MVNGRSREPVEMARGPPTSLKSDRTMTAAFVFPGQGSQEVGMGKALAESFASAKQVFDEVDDASIRS